MLKIFNKKIIFQPQIRPGVQEHAEVQHFQQTFNTENCSEAVVKIAQLLVSVRVFLDWILHSESYTAQQDHEHDESIEEGSGDEPVKADSNTEKYHNINVILV